MRVYLFDIQEAIHKIEEFVGESAWEDYEQNAMMRAAVERMFMIIGEALHRLNIGFPVREAE